MTNLAILSSSNSYVVDIQLKYLDSVNCEQRNISCLLVKKYWTDGLYSGKLVALPKPQESSKIINNYILNYKIPAKEILSDLKIKFFMNAHILQSSNLSKKNFISMSNQEIVFLNENNQRIIYSKGCFNIYYCIKWPNPPQTDSMGVPNIVQINRPLVSTLIK